MSCKLKEHEAYSSLTDALEDSRLSRHVSYVPAGELCDEPVVITLERVSPVDFDYLVNGYSEYTTGIRTAK